MAVVSRFKLHSVEELWVFPPYIRVYIHTYVGTCIHTCCTCIHTCIHTYGPSSMHSHTDTHIHTHTHTQTNVSRQPSILIFSLSMIASSLNQPILPPGDVKEGDMRTHSTAMDTKKLQFM